MITLFLIARSILIKYVQLSRRCHGVGVGCCSFETSEREMGKSFRCFGDRGSGCGHRAT